MAGGASNSVDTGYAWVVLTSCCVMRILLDGFWCSLGVLFVKWEQDFMATSSQTSLIGSIYILNLSLVAPMSSALVNRLSYRSVVVAAGLCAFVSCFAASLVTQFWHLYITMALLSIGMGISYAASYACLIPYFKQRLAFAYMISSAFSGIGYLSMPPLMLYLTKYYTWKGALQITSAIMANICVCGFLLPSSLRTTSKQAEQHKDIDFNVIPETDSTVGASCRKFFDDVKADFDLRLFRNVRFLFQAIVGGVFVGSMSVFGVYLIPYTIRIGIPESQTSLLMLIYGILIVVSRMSPIAWLVDEKIISAPHLGGLANLVLGIIMIVTPFVRNFAHLVAVCVIYGVSQGIGGCMITIVVAASPGVKEQARGALAWYIIAYGIGCLTSVFFAGFLCDLTGGYQYSLILCGVWIIGDAIILLCDPLLSRWQSRLEGDRQEYSFSKEEVKYKTILSGNVKIDRV